MRNKAFTLAEVLITLGIIGIVAAMTFPSLIEKHQKKVAAVRLKQAYSQLSQALLFAQNDYGESKYWVSIKGQVASEGNRQSATTEWVEKYVVPYLHGAKVHGWKTLGDVGYKKAYVALNGQPLSSGGLTTLTGNSATYYIELPNQMLLSFDYNSDYDVDGILYRTDIFCQVDINGKQKPNVIGRDLFGLTFDMEKGRWEPFGIGNSRRDLLNRYCTRSNPSGNMFCAAVIVLDGWEIRDDYPW